MRQDQGERRRRRPREKTGQMGVPPPMGIACLAVRLRPGGNERPPRTLALFPAQDPHRAHRCSLPRARPASFRNSSWRNSMAAAPAAGPPRPADPPARGPGQPRPGTRGPPRPGRPRSSARGEGGCECGLSGGCHWTQRRGWDGARRGPAPCILVPPAFRSPPSRFLPRPSTPRPRLWVLNSRVWVASPPVLSLPGITPPLIHPPRAPSTPDFLSSRVLSHLRFAPPDSVPPNFVPTFSSPTVSSSSEFPLRFILPALSLRISVPSSSTSCPAPSIPRPPHPQFQLPHSEGSFLIQGIPSPSLDSNPHFDTPIVPSSSSPSGFFALDSHPPVSIFPF